MAKCNMGVDVGNFNLKTVHTTTPNGFTEHVNKPFSTKEYLLYDDKYYIPDTERFQYLQDKTTNEHAYILTLMGIAKEIIYRAEKIHEKKLAEAKEDPSLKSKILGIQGEIDKFCAINLGVGVPPIHFSSLSGPTKEYYKERLSNEVKFVYNGYHFCIKVDYCECYPQDHAAVIGYVPRNKETSVTSFKSYYAIDIGGQTVDIITFIDGSINMGKCDSKPLGVLVMYETIIKNIEMETGKRIEKDIIDSVLKNEPTVLKEEMKQLIVKHASEWFDHIMASLVQFGMDFDSYPVLFLGGGSLLFKPFIDNYGFPKHEFIKDPNANAVGYEKLIRIAASKK